MSRPDRGLQRRPDRAGRRAGRGLRAPGQRRSSPASSASRTCSSATGDASRSGPRRSGCSSDGEDADGPARPRRGRIVRRRLRGDDHPLPGRARGRGRASSRPPEPRDVLGGGARAERAGGDRRMAAGAHGRRPSASNEEEHSECESERIPREVAWLDRRGAARVHARVRGRLRRSDDDDERRRATTLPSEVGEREGEVNLSPGPATSRTARPTRRSTGSPTSRRRPAARSTSRSAAPPTRWSQLMRTGQYDGVSASGDATGRLVEGGDVAPVNTDLVPNYATSSTPEGPAVQHVRRRQLRDPARPRREPADVEHGRGRRPPDVVGAVFDPTEAAKYNGQASRAYDDPIYIADAALYLKEHQPDLGIDRPVRARRGAVRRRGRPAQAAAARTSASTGPTTRSRSRRSRTATSTVGTTWQYQYFTLLAEGEPADPGRGRPARGGRDRVVGHLDDQLRGRAPELHVPVDGPHHQPGGERQVAAWFGEAPANEKACDRVKNLDPRTSATADHCELYHADDAEFCEQSTTGRRRRGLRRRPRRRCKDYDEWVQAWTEIKG